MPILKKQTIYSVLFALCIMVPYLNIYELTFAVWLFTFFFSIKKKYSTGIFKLTGFFCLILTVAFFSSWTENFKLYDFIRDITYLLKPIIGLLLGYQLFRTDYQRGMKTVVYTGLALALAHLSIVFFTFLKYKVADIHLLREHSGYFSDYEIYALVVLIFWKRLELDFSRRKILVFTLLLAVSCFLYLARTNMIQLVLLSIALLGYFRLTKRAVKILTICTLLGLLGYAAIYYANPRRQGKGLEALMYKIKIAPIEPFKTKINEDDWKDFNDNYRSFENILVVDKISAGNFKSLLVGQGLGAKIDLGRKVMSNDGSYVRFIAIVHNGFMTVFLKSGLVGVFFCLWSIFFMFKRSPEPDQYVYNLNNIMVGTGVFLFISYWVFLGFYFKFDTKSVLIGYLFCMREALVKKDASTVSVKVNSDGA